MPPAALDPLQSYLPPSPGLDGLVPTVSKTQCRASSARGSRQSHAPVRLITHGSHGPDKRSGPFLCLLLHAQEDEKSDCEVDRERATVKATK